jgi:carbamate kinase
MAKRIVIAMGGNAIKQADEDGTAQEQRENIRNSCRQILEIIRAGYEVVVTHGNGPQVGNLLIQQDAGSEQTPVQPMDVCGAMTQGQIGYMLQQALVNELRSRNMTTDVVTVITQVMVDKDDPDFVDPSKPVGPFYDEAAGRRYEMERGYRIKEVLPEGDRRFRRVVPSPDPIRILEGTSLKRLVDAGMVVVASGGGGIPVFLNTRGEWEGVDGVIDKDLAGEKLAEAVAADLLVILTDVDTVKLHFGTSKERSVNRLTVKAARQYLAEGHFLEGSMAPKVLACIRFLEYGGEEAIITSLDNAWAALSDNEGTHVVP